MTSDASAIVVEGGGMRGIFSAGVLDAFLEARFNPFAFAIGCSAGACNLASHLAGQHGRNRRCYTGQMSRREFIDAGRFLRGGHWLDLDYLWDAFAREDPLDVHGATRSETRLLVVATDVETGNARYFEPQSHDVNEVLRASCAVPILYRKFVEIAGRAYVDGGVSAAIPVEEAYRRGARRIMVVRSRPASYAKKAGIESWIGSAIYRKRPALAEAIRSVPGAYARALQLIRNPPPDCRIVEVAPESPLQTSRTGRDPAGLLADYERGRVAGQKAMQAWS